MKKILIITALIPVFFLILIKPVQAICPVCTVAVAAGVGLSRWLGIDDTITGLWIGGLIVSMIIWTLDWFKKKNIRFPGRKIITIVGYYAIIVLPLRFTNIIGHPLNTLFGYRFLDKLMTGIAVGSLGFYLAARLYEYLKAKNGGHAHFPFEKVVLPVSPLIILSIIFYFLTK